MDFFKSHIGRKIKLEVYRVALSEVKKAKQMLR